MADGENMWAENAEAWPEATDDGFPLAGGVPRISSCRGSWPGMTAECVEMLGPERHKRPLRSDHASLVVILDSVGGICEIRSALAGALYSRTNGFDLVSTIPAGIDAWLYADGITYLRFVVIGFDLAGLAPDLPSRPAFAIKTMVADPTLFQYGRRIANACEGLDRSGELHEGSLSRAALLAAGSLSLRVASVGWQPSLAPWQLRRVTEFIEQNLTDPPSLPALAALCRLSPSHFGRAFKGSTGISPHRWMTNMRIRYAQSVLATGDVSLAEVAGLAAFADQSHFSRVFANATGRTPGAWRREISARLDALDDPPRDFPAIRTTDGHDFYRKSPRRRSRRV
jgi:AraC family transcriptional regulator